VQHFGTVVSPPVEWPTVPEKMSFSVLAEIESCAFRWGLTRGQYDGLWSGRGYPSKPNAMSIVGQVIHRAVEVVVKSSQSETDDDFGKRILAALSGAGGLTKIIGRSLDDVLRQYAENPRAERLLDQYRTGRVTLPTSVRTTVQLLLRDVAALRVPVKAPHISAEKTKTAARTRLRPGAYSEVVLSAKEFDWIGKIDLLVVTDDGAELEDIKTGAPKEAHKDQLVTYAWLWLRDQESNPDGQPYTRLTIRYPDKTVDVPLPSSSEIATFERRLLARTSIVQAAISKKDFPPRPDAANCQFCGVRQLCDTYWRDVVKPLSVTDSGRFDIEATVVSIVSTRTCELRIRNGLDIPDETVVYLRGHLPKLDIVVGSKLRIVNAAYFESSGESSVYDVPVVQLCNGSEVYLMP